MTKQTNSPLARVRARARRVYVLIACEESQAECMAFREVGAIAYSCDIQPCKPSGHPEYHIQHDVTPYLQGRLSFRTMDGRYHHVPRWDLIVCHPPCTYLCKVSAVRMVVNGQLVEKRYIDMKKAREFFYECLQAKAPFVAVENPLPMARAQLPRPSFYLQPSWFGHKYTKKTLYWVKNLPPIMPTIEYPNPKSYVLSSRGKYRSRTFPNLAKEMARQWYDYILQQRMATLNSSSGHL